MVHLFFERSSQNEFHDRKTSIHSGVVVGRAKYKAATLFTPFFFPLILCTVMAAQNVFQNVFLNLPQCFPNDSPPNSLGPHDRQRSPVVPTEGMPSAQPFFNSARVQIPVGVLSSKDCVLLEGAFYVPFIWGTPIGLITPCHSAEVRGRGGGGFGRHFRVAPRRWTAGWNIQGEPCKVRTRSSFSPPPPAHANCFPTITTLQVYPSRRRLARCS